MPSLPNNNFNASLSSYLSSDCWQEQPLPGNTNDNNDIPHFDPDYLNRIHIATVVIVSLCGSVLLIFLAMCVCLSNDKVMKLLKRKPLTKGIEGEFHFLILDSSGGDPRDEDEERICPHSGKPIPVVVVPDTDELIDTGGLLSGGTPQLLRRERLDTIGTNTLDGNGSLLSVVLDDYGGSHAALDDTMSTYSSKVVDTSKLTV